MKQVVQYPASGKIETVEVPVPVLQDEGVLVRTSYSVLSPGTERAALEFGKQPMAGKAVHHPDLVRRVLQKASRDGIVSTIRGVRERMNRPGALGYSSAGTVTHVGNRVRDLRVGDRVACAGNQYAYHAEVVYVPQNLAVRVPETVPFDQAAFATVGAIALQGVRISELSVGDRVAVVGMGLVGQLTAQIARAAGAKVLAVDLDPRRVELASNLGSDIAVLRTEAEAAASRISDGHGVDVVLLTAATPSNDPIQLAATMAREKARVVVVGDVGMAVPRELFYVKELELRLSRSYGPGRYDPTYEEAGNDYPYGYVRWTEQRNLAAFLELVASGSVHVEPLITHRVPVTSAAEAYELIDENTAEHSLGVLLSYEASEPVATRITLTTPTAQTTDAVNVGVVGAGQFARSVLLPVMKSVPNVSLRGVVTGSGISAAAVGKQFGFHYCASTMDELLGDEDVDCIVVATRHNLHAQQVAAALNAGKDVFVEKPLALSNEELQAVVRAQQRANRKLMVGFNRRFAPLVVKMREFLARRVGPLVMTYRANAGSVPATHWTQDPAIGGGRIIGEACHFVDVLQYLAGSAPVSVFAQAVIPGNTRVQTNDEAVLTVRFADGSVGTIVYSGGGDSTYPKERIEAFGDGRVAVLDDFDTLELAHEGHKESHRSRPAGDKGHANECHAFFQAIRSGDAPPIALEEAVAATLTTFRAMDSLRSGQSEQVDLEHFLQVAIGSIGESRGDGHA